MDADAYRLWEEADPELVPDPEVEEAAQAELKDIHETRVELEAEARAAAKAQLAAERKDRTYDPSPMPDAAALAKLHQSEVTLVDVLNEAGDALFACQGTRLTAKRSLACTNSVCRAMIFTHLRGPVLSVTWLDATWANAAFVARLLVPAVPEQVLCMQGERCLPEMKLAHLCTLPRLKMGTLGWPAALFLGAAIAESDATLRLSDGTTCRAIKPLRERAKIELPGMSSDADLCAMLGALVLNPHCIPEMQGQLHVRPPRTGGLLAEETEHSEELDVGPLLAPGRRYVAEPMQHVGVVPAFRDAFGEPWRTQWAALREDIIYTEFYVNLRFSQEVQKSSQGPSMLNLS